jgi:hypothetical protein
LEGAIVGEADEAVGLTHKFHSGQPIFHEGSKGYSCCKRRTLEFDEFLLMEGCKTGKHRFTEPIGVKKAVTCRNDYFQSPTTVTVSFYAKKVDKSKSKVEFFSDSMNVLIHFVDGSVYEWKKQLFQPIVTTESTYEVLSTKIEIVLKKANGLSWLALTSEEKPQGFVTFGVSGKVGTVGSKESITAGDLLPTMMK